MGGVDAVFLSPRAGAVVLVGCLPVAAAAIAHAHADTVATTLGLRPRGGGRLRRRVAAIAAVSALLAVAAAQPAVRASDAVAVRNDVAVYVVFDVTRSMLASNGPSGSSRIREAKTAAVDIRARLPTLRVGVASLTDRVVPHLLPSPDRRAFSAVVRDSVAVEGPPPSQRAYLATNYDALREIGRNGFFTQRDTRRVAVVLGDGESSPFDAAGVARSLRAAHVVPVLVRVGSRRDRIYRANRSPERYRGQRTTDALETLAGVLGDSAARTSAEAASAIRRAAGSGKVGPTRRVAQTVSLAPAAAALALAPLAYLLGTLAFLGRGAVPSRGAERA